MEVDMGSSWLKVAPIYYKPRATQQAPEFTGLANHRRGHSCSFRRVDLQGLQSAQVLQAVAFNLVVEGALADAQQVSGFAPIPVNGS